MSHTKISRAVGVIASGIALLAATAGVGAQQTSSEEVPTFAKDVAPLLYKNCVSCHRPGEMGPMSLVTYQDARPWARSIRDRVVARSMPPWFADPHYGTFSNDPTLSQKDIDTIVAWVAGGAPQGDPRQMPKLPRHDGRRLADRHARRRSRDAGGIPGSRRPGRSATRPTT